MEGGGPDMMLLTTETAARFPGCYPAEIDSSQVLNILSVGLFNMRWSQVPGTRNRSHISKEHVASYLLPKTIPSVPLTGQTITRSCTKKTIRRVSIFQSLQMSIIVPSGAISHPKYKSE